MEIPAVKAAQSSPPQRPESAPRAERAPEPEPKPQETSRPAPVVNTQGQTTGRIVNTTA
jgi:hypothetical protein